MEKYNLIVWKEKYKKGHFKNINSQIDAGWFDWYCSKKELVKKTKVLSEIILSLENSNKITLSNTYVLFSNHLRVNGSKYDAISFFTLHDQKKFMIITIDSNIFSVYLEKHQFTRDCFKTSSIQELIYWLNT